MPFIPTIFPGLIIFEPSVFEDSRGYFYEAFNNRLFRENNIDVNFVQDNQSRSMYGVIRGLHFQHPPFAQTKLIRVLSGSILDLVVDLRVGSPTYGETFSIELSATNRKQLFIPKGFGHGFSVISESAEVLYKCDEFYYRESEGGLNYKDPDLSIDWNIPADREVVSEKDKELPLFKNYAGNFIFTP
jgi:dTDP-4-dehydrorhamnose 3,5-epimerase